LPLLPVLAFGLAIADETPAKPLGPATSNSDADTNNARKAVATALVGVIKAFPFPAFEAHIRRACIFVDRALEQSLVRRQQFMSI
jgi:hypothetical protein